MELLVDGCPLGKDTPHSHVGCIHLYYELAVRVRNLEDGGWGELGLEGLESPLSRGSSVEGQLGVRQLSYGLTSGRSW